MQPDEQNSEFKQPEPTAYYSAPPKAEPEIANTVVEPQIEQEAPALTELAPDAPLADDSQPVSTTQPVSWQANEYIHQEKNPLWFVAFGLIVVALIVGAVFMQAWTFVGLIPVMATALFLYTRRPPHVIDYVLSEKGLYINDILHPFAEFKGFGVIRDGREYSVMLIPVRRFRPGVSVYFPEESGEAIVDLLGARLPMQELHLDAFDKVVRALRI